MPVIVLCHGCFDAGVHPGHLAHFEKAKKFGDRLIVSITADKHVNKGPGRPIFPESERVRLVAALRCVSAAIISEDPDCTKIIKNLRPNIFCKGGDYKYVDPIGNLEKEKAAVESYGGRLIILDNDITYSSTEILSGKLLKRRIEEEVSKK